MLKKTLAICAVLITSLSLLPLAQAAHHGMKKDIVDIAVENGSFTTLVTALQAAELVDTLKGEGPFTVFAPTDEAFSKLPEGTVEMLLLPENKEKLQSILTYHVVSGKVMAADVMKIALRQAFRDSPSRSRRWKEK